MTFEVRIMPAALAQLEAIQDRRVRRAVFARIEALVEDADQQGKPLVGALAGHRSVRAVGQRYRVIYRIAEGRVQVEVVCLGLRKESDKKANVYALAEKLHKAGLLK